MPEVTARQVFFITLPAELRLAIYDLLLVGHGNRVLSIRNEEPSTYRLREKEHGRRRSSFRTVMIDGQTTFRLETSYTLTANPGIFPSILGADKQIHQEAGHMLYSSHVFDFGQDVECVIPFLSDLMPSSRASIKCISLTQKALPQIKWFDRYEWRDACDFISRHLTLTRLGLGIVGGKPAKRWEAKDAFEKSDFPLITSLDGMEWVEQLAAIKGLQNLEIKACMEPHPLPQSNAATFFVNFSASIEEGFAEYLKERMVARAA